MASLCQKIRGYRELLKDRASFNAYLAILRNGLTRKVLLVVLEERRGYLEDLQRRFSRSWEEIGKQKRFTWLKPFMVKRVEEWGPDITRLLYDKGLRTKLAGLLDYLLKLYGCPV